MSANRVAGLRIDGTNYAPRGRGLLGRTMCNRGHGRDRSVVRVGRVLAVIALATFGRPITLAFTIRFV